LREYTGREVNDFIRSDGLDQEAQAIAERFLSANE
jgi:hypothetical protein